MRDAMTTPPPEQSLRWRWLNAIKSTPPTDERWTPGALGVAVALWTFADDDGGGIYPGDARIARMAGCSVRQARRLRGDVLSLGLIERVSAATSKATAAVYLLVSPDLWVSAEPEPEVAPEPEPEVAPIEQDAEAWRCPALGEIDGVVVRCVRRKGHRGEHWQG